MSQSARETVGCPVVFSIIKTGRLRFFGHLARSDSRQDHHRAINASLRRPRDWRRPRRCPRTTSLSGIDADVQTANIGIHSAWSFLQAEWIPMFANDRVLWQRYVSTWQKHSIMCTPLSKLN